ncbi:MAG: Fe2+-dependent dioxygenase [Moraxellaceae bacterium]|nr:Fe2+-dependent dioxygenase [Moraxellaceae bacterium]MBK9185838.1 Fe2+-dependent dioxygenase [Moraxellaceae bacterium]
MLLHIPQVLNASQLAEIRHNLHTASWQAGATTAGGQAAKVKHNLQLPQNLAIAQHMAQQVREALLANPLFVSAVLPKQLLMPLFNCYQQGGHFGNHVDGAIQYETLTRLAVRTDVSTTVFLSEPDEYEGGELVIEDNYGSHEVKLAAGDAIVYPATSLHRVDPVTDGQRFAAFLWSQSMVRDNTQRQLLFDLDMTIIRLRQQLQDSPEVVSLTNHYHNLLRQWVA